jgi:hypothetical protein
LDCSSAVSSIPATVLLSIICDIILYLDVEG